MGVGRQCTPARGKEQRHIHACLPEQAGTLITRTHQTADDLLSPWQGFGVLCIWTVLALAVAAYLLEHRDA